MQDMGRFWDGRAAENARSAICYHATEDDFERYGRDEAEYLLDLMRASVIDRHLDTGIASDEGIDCWQILDVGGGIGRVAMYLAPEVHAYHLLDCSAEMLRQGRERLGHLGQQVRFHHMDGIHYPDIIIPNSLDFAFCDLVFQHIDREIVVYHLMQILRRLRPGAWFWLQIPAQRYPHRLEEAVRGDWPAHLHRWQPGDFLEVAVRIGYRVIGADLDSMQIILAKPGRDLPGWLQGRGE